MAAQTTTSSNDPVKQFSVFCENRLGRLYDLTALLKESNVHVMGITVLDTTDSSIVRFIADDPDKARELMINNDFPYTECDLLAVEIVDESELKGVLAALFEAEINITISTASSNARGKMRACDQYRGCDVAAQAVNKSGYRVLTQRDIAAVRKNQATAFSPALRPSVRLRVRRVRSYNRSRTWRRP